MAPCFTFRVLLFLSRNAINTMLGAPVQKIDVPVKITQAHTRFDKSSEPENPDLVSGLRKIRTWNRRNSILSNKCGPRVMLSRIFVMHIRTSTTEIHKNICQLKTNRKSNLRDRYNKNKFLLRTRCINYYYSLFFLSSDSESAHQNLLCTLRLVSGSKNCRSV